MLGDSAKRKGNPFVFLVPEVWRDGNLIKSWDGTECSKENSDSAVCTAAHIEKAPV
jgi:hypothetical protein